MEMARPPRWHSADSGLMVISSPSSRNSQVSSPSSRNSQEFRIRPRSFPYALVHLCPDPAISDLDFAPASLFVGSSRGVPVHAELLGIHLASRAPARGISRRVDGNSPDRALQSLGRLRTRSRPGGKRSGSFRAGQTRSLGETARLFSREPKKENHIDLIEAWIGLDGLG